MSVQFGRWNLNGRALDQDYLARVGEMVAPYGPDGEGAYIKDNVGILFRAFHTTKESRTEAQPYVRPSGAVLTWDGRLDNRRELACELRETLTTDATDVAIVAAAYETWGTAAFAKLVGDWALSIWEPRNRSLVLAKDTIGTRSLYYSSNKDQITWSSVLDPLVLLALKSFTLEEEYIAGWLSFFPATHLTPYKGIHSVPPSCFVRLRSDQHRTGKYWNFDPAKKIRYRTDGEYEEHFRAVFEESVRRRLRSDCPVLAELSGGMDSSSIVCMADEIIARGDAETLRLDTVSSYSDSEPNWDERPYFSKVEEKRGRIGCHINVGNQEPSSCEGDAHCFAATPAASTGIRTDAMRHLAAFVESQGNRVLLSGLGGDEVLGGVPTAVPELADLAATFHSKTLLQQALAWALSKRRPVLHILWDTFKEFLPSLGPAKHSSTATLLYPAFLGSNRSAMSGYATRLSFFGPLPSFQQNLASLEFLRRQLSCATPSRNPLLETTYPYLDRDLLAFLFAIPREQLVRPGRRRSLMRRALSGIVPSEILERRRKAFVSRGPVAAVLNSKVLTKRPLLAGELGIVNPLALAGAMRTLAMGGDVSVVLLLRTLSLEKWLADLDRLKLIDAVHPCDACPSPAKGQSGASIRLGGSFRRLSRDSAVGNGIQPSKVENLHQAQGEPT